jgi:hypothetical protein
MSNLREMDMVSCMETNKEEMLHFTNVTNLTHLYEKVNGST